MDATDLVNEMAAGKLCSEEVVLAFGLRAAVSHQLVSQSSCREGPWSDSNWSILQVCCLTDFWLEDALVRARELDAIFKATGKVVGPLHGLPISLKVRRLTGGLPCAPQKLTLLLDSFVVRISSRSRGASRPCPS